MKNTGSDGTVKQLVGETLLHVFLGKHQQKPAVVTAAHAYIEVPSEGKIVVLTFIFFFLFSDR